MRKLFQISVFCPKIQIKEKIRFLTQFDKIESWKKWKKKFGNEKNLKQNPEKINNIFFQKNPEKNNNFLKKNLEKFNWTFFYFKKMIFLHVSFKSSWQEGRSPGDRMTIENQFTVVSSQNIALDDVYVQFIAKIYGTL